LILGPTVVAMDQVLEMEAKLGIAIRKGIRGPPSRTKKHRNSWRDDGSVQNRSSRGKGRVPDVVVCLVEGKVLKLRPGVPYPMNL